MRAILQLNYGLVLISHAVDKTFKDQNGQEYNQIVPTLDNKPRNVVSRLADIIGYSRAVEDADGNISTKLFMRGTPRFMAGSRFKYTPDYIDFTYSELVNAICSAIDKQMAEDGTEYFTSENSNLHIVMTKELNFDDLMSEFKRTLDTLVASCDEDTFAEQWQPRITQVIETYLGKGMKVSQCTRDQVEALDLIVTDLKDFLK